MKSLKNFTPAKHGVIIGFAVGIATKNIGIGIIIILFFSVVSFLKTKKI